MRKIQIVAVFLALLASVSAFAQKPQRVAVLPVRFKTDYAPKPAKTEDFRAYVQDALINEFTKAVQKAGNEMVTSTEIRLATDDKFQLPDDSKKQIDAFRSANVKLNADVIVLFQLENVTQKSSSPSEVMNNPKLPQSETKIKVRVWVYMAKDDLFEQGGDTLLESKFGGGYLGTLSDKELYGEPDAKALEITNGLKKRALYIAKAMMLALSRRAS